MKLINNKISLIICVAFLYSGCTLFHISKLTGFSSKSEELRIYNFTCSKSEINEAMKKVFMRNPQYKAPDKYNRNLIHNYPDLSTPKSRTWNADSIQFHFYLKTEKGNENLYWLRFQGHQKNWNSNSCILILEDYFDGKETITKSNFNIFKPLKKDKGIIIFEKEILEKIRFNLPGIKITLLEHFN